MNNSAVLDSLNHCMAELNQIQSIISGLGPTSNIVPYLNKYSVIKACGTIEQAIKSIIADYCSKRSKQQVKNFLTNRVRMSSANPSYNNICSLLKAFDSAWHKQFKKRVDAMTNKTQILDSLQSLVDARNEFAHGGNPVVSVNDVIAYFGHAQQLIFSLDTIIS